MRICEEHDGAVVVYDAMDCPVCDEVNELENRCEEAEMREES